MTERQHARERDRERKQRRDRAQRFRFGIEHQDPGERECADGVSARK
jgi:hypothetical protein